MTPRPLLAFAALVVGALPTGSATAKDPPSPGGLLAEVCHEVVHEGLGLMLPCPSREPCRDIVRDALGKPVACSAYEMCNDIVHETLGFMVPCPPG